jgi:hypothetical protein
MFTAIIRGDAALGRPVSAATLPAGPPACQKAHRNRQDLHAKMITAGAWSHMGLTLTPPATAKITKEG